MSTFHFKITKHTKRLVQITKNPEEEKDSRKRPIDDPNIGGLFLKS